MILNNKWLSNEIKEKIKKYKETSENENTTSPKPMRHSESSPERGVCSITGLPKEDRKISNKQLNSLPKRRRKITNKAQKEGNNQDQRRIECYRN